MRKWLKPILMLLGTGLIGYSLYVKEAVIRSPASAVENALLNAARQDADAFHRQFHAFTSRLAADWDRVMVFGLAIVLASAAIKHPANP